MAMFAAQGDKKGDQVATKQGGKTPRRAAAGSNDAPLRRLVVVESPAKARTIGRYLGAGYTVEASVGHIRDLAEKRSELPEELRKEPWAEYAVDWDNGFAPFYVIDADKRAKVRDLKALLKDADELLLATDEDREGEAIAWHLMQVLEPKIPTRRMVFHEITPAAIQAAANDTREIDRDLVEAQETRRVLDRLYGYRLSDVVRRKLKGQSAGRVQSVALRLVVERERARIAFRSAGYWDLDADLLAAGARGPFTARLAAVDGRRVATGRDFDELGVMKAAAVRDQVVVLQEAAAQALAGALQQATVVVRSVEEKPYRRSPAAPFMTSTLQQEASRKLRWGAQRTMKTAQGLYEDGLITYMRTDSTTLSDVALEAARRQARELFGAANVSETPRRYERKVKNAQEAHEAIRPASDDFVVPVRTGLSGDRLALYDLIWKRTLASQMTDARGSTVTVRAGAGLEPGAGFADAELSASGTTITHPGFRAVYTEDTDEVDESDDESILPPLSVGQGLTAVDVRAAGHRTSPPARYTEASLVKALEELGIGRPSTYASILGTIQAREYVFKKGSALVPSWLGMAVTRLMEEHFPRLVDYTFTAGVEDALDQIAGGEASRVHWLTSFWFGDPEQQWKGLGPLAEEQLGLIDARAIATFTLAPGEPDDPAGGALVGAGVGGGRGPAPTTRVAAPVSTVPVVLRVGKYGTFVEEVLDDAAVESGVTPRRANVPEDLPPDELTGALARSWLDKPSGDRALGMHPQTGLVLLAKDGRYGPYVVEELAPDAGKNAKPRTASLFRAMSLDTITLDQAVELLQLPRVVGLDPADGEEIVASNGRYGPYLKKGSDTRSLESEDQLLTIDVEQALAVLAQPKQRGRRGAAPAAPAPVIGVDPNSGGEITLRDGRFGPYVTDGTTNASLRKGDDPQSLTLERSVELLADRRGAAPVAKKAAVKRVAAKKAPAKKAAPAAAAAKKATAKAAAKAGAKKTTAKKSAPSAVANAGTPAVAAAVLG